MIRLPFVHPRRLGAGSEPPLSERRRRRVEAHLARCAGCRARAREIERGLVAARALRPEPLPAERRRQIARALATAPDAAAPSPLLAGSLRRSVTAGAATGAALLALLVWSDRRGVEVEAAATPPGRLETLALAAYGELASGERPLDLATSSPAEVRAWLGGLGLAAALVDERPGDEAARYRLAGALDLSRPGLAAAGVLVRVDGAPLVLVAAREDQVPDAPRWSPLGKRVRYRQVGATGLLTWTNSGKAYALASELPRVRSGCLLCHLDERRRELVRDLALPEPGGS